MKKIQTEIIIVCCLSYSLCRNKIYSFEKKQKLEIERKSCDWNVINVRLNLFERYLKNIYYYSVRNIADTKIERIDRGHNLENL